MSTVDVEVDDADAAAADSDDEEADEVDPDFDPDHDVTMCDAPPTSRKRPRKAPPAPRPKQRRKTKAAPVEPILSEYELGRRAKIKRNNKFLVSVGLLFPPCVRGVPRCCGAFTPSTRLVSRNHGGGRFLFRFWADSDRVEVVSRSYW